MEKTVLFSSHEVCWFFDGASVQHESLRRWFETVAPFAKNPGLDVAGVLTSDLVLSGGGHQHFTFLLQQLFPIDRLRLGKADDRVGFSLMI